MLTQLRIASKSGRTEAAGGCPAEAAAVTSPGWEGGAQKSVGAGAGSASARGATAMVGDSGGGAMEGEIGAG